MGPFVFLQKLRAAGTLAANFANKGRFGRVPPEVHLQTVRIRDFLGAHRALDAHVPADVVDRAEVPHEALHEREPALADVAPKRLVHALQRRLVVQLLVRAEVAPVQERLVANVALVSIDAGVTLHVFDVRVPVQKALVAHLAVVRVLSRVMFRMDSYGRPELGHVIAPGAFVYVAVHFGVDGQVRQPAEF